MAVAVHCRSYTTLPYNCRTQQFTGSFKKAAAMARTVRNPKIDTRSARVKLPIRREPYWTGISAGCHVGYRRGKDGGSWLAKMRTDDGRRHYAALGPADDARDADGLTVFDFGQAQVAARRYFEEKAKQLAGHVDIPSTPYSVEQALEDYFVERERRGSKSVNQDRAAARLHILPELGRLTLDRLTTKKMRDWQAATGSAPKIGATHTKTKKRLLKPIDVTDPDAVRARRATGNRILSVLKAALNFAFNEGRVASDTAWRKVRPFREANAPVVQFLSEDDCRRIVNACSGTFRHIVRGALVSGCRYGELTRMRVADFNSNVGTLTVQLSKSGKARHVVLADEGRMLFTQLTDGRVGTDLIFTRDDGKKWGTSHQQRPLAAASARAKVEPAATFHILRHTYASSLAMKGVPLGVIAAQLGHADTRVTERHYAHLAPSYVADTVRAALPSLGIVEPINVARLKLKESAQ